MRCSVLRICTVVSVAYGLRSFPITICEKKKEAWCYFFDYWIISSGGSLLASKIFDLEKILQLSAFHHARWPLYKLWEDRFSLPDPVSFPLPPAKYYLWCSHINVIIYVTGKSKVRNFAHLVFADKNIASSQITMNDLKVIQKTKQTNKQNN